MEYSIEYLKKRVEEHPEKIKNMIRTQLNKCEDSIDSTGYLDYLELASIALSKDGLLLEQIESEIANKDYVRLAGIAIINNPEVYSKVKKSKIDLVLTEGGSQIDPFSSFDLGEIGEDNSKEIPDYEELEYYFKVSKDPRYIMELPTELKHYKDIILASVKRKGYTLSFVPTKMIDKEIALAAIKQNYIAIQFVPQDIEDYETIAMEALKKIIGINNDGKKEKEIILAAIEITAGSLRYVPKRMIDKEIALAAVKKFGGLLRFVPKEIIDNEVALTAVENNGIALQFVPNEIIDKKMALVAVQQNALARLYVPPIIDGYEEVIYTANICAVKKCFDIYIIEDNKYNYNDDDFVAYLIRCLKYTKPLAEEALRQYYEYLDNNQEKTI